ncbi:glucosaminidase domain-containing protein [Hydrogenovibrio halophilus]|uniref:glucosaminidase domain-containing protein n=1 Tax=Hydrogenovibrio halophilus TaxID=373391 RepID=UPI0003756824|nr:glucosaminidase domain-containing protein [Hydrogenovibrio halophilus]
MAAFSFWLSGCSEEPSEQTDSQPAITQFDRPPDFSSFDAGPPRKQAFFEYFAPLIHQANQSIQTKRERLKTLIDQNSLPEKDQAWLKTQAELFGLEVSGRFDPDRSENQKALLTRIDTIPTSLALAQAANESAWGTSRFARKAHNYFGQWCYQPGCGLVPEQRISGADHEVRAFDHPYESVKSYLHNLNSHSAYADLRRIRAQLRNANQPVTGVALAEGLLHYSERREAYVEELRSMIRYNELSRFNLNAANQKD